MTTGAASERREMAPYRVRVTWFWDVPEFRRGLALILISHDLGVTVAPRLKRDHQRSVLPSYGQSLLTGSSRSGGAANSATA